MSGLSSTLGLVGERPAEEILRRLTLDVNRKLDGMLHGDFLGLVPGRGGEPGETRAYEPGDDVRRIDWNVTARMQNPYIRETIADRELEAWLVVDRSARLDFGTAACEKRDLVLAAAAGVGLLTGRGGNRVGAIVLRGEEITTVPPRHGRTHLLGILERIMSTPRSDGSGPADLTAALRRAGAIAPRRGLGVVLSYFLVYPHGWTTALVGHWSSEARRCCRPGSWRSSATSRKATWSRCAMPPAFRLPVASSSATLRSCAR